MKVVVTGGAGFVGSHIVDALIERGHSPFVIDDFSSGSRQNLPADVPVYEADIRDRAEISSIFAEIQPDALSHQAAQISVSRSMREPIFDADVNVMGLLNVFEHAVKVGVKRIAFASSGGVLYGEVTVPATEDFPKRPMSGYGVSKWTGEQYLEFYARSHGIQGVALRYSNVYGPRQNPHGEAGVVAAFTRLFLSGNTATINGDGKYYRDFVYGPDVALANVMALEKTLEDNFTAINVGTGIAIDINTLAVSLSSKVQEYLISRGSRLQIPPCKHGPPRAGDLKSNIVSSSLAKQILGWTPSTEFSQGLEATVRWFGDHSDEKSNSN